MSYNFRDDYQPSELTAIRGDLVAIKRQLGDLQSTSASTSFRLAARDETRQPDLGSILLKALTAQFIGNKEFLAGGPAPVEIAERIYSRGPGGHMIAKAARIITGLATKAAVSPASTTTTGYAAELTGSANYDGVLPAIAPASVYSQLAQRSLRVSFAGIGVVKIPTKLASPLVAGDFVGESQPVPVRRLGLAATSVGPPRKLAVISHFSDELRGASTPTIEATLKFGITNDTATTLDAKLLDTAAASTTRPAGLLNGVTPLTPTAGGGVGALAGDLGNLAAAIPNAADLVFLMNASERTRALAISPGLLAITILETPGLPSKQIVAIDAGEFVSGEGDSPRFTFSEQATLHQEDTTPLPIGTTGSPNVVAAPAQSLWQQDLVSLRFIQYVTWVMGRANRIATVTGVTW